MRVEIRRMDGPSGEGRVEGFFISPDGNRQEFRNFAGGPGNRGPGNMGPGGPGMGGPGGPGNMGPGGPPAMRGMEGGMGRGGPGRMGQGGPSAMRGMEERLSKLERNVERLLDQVEKLNRRSPRD
jgi:hypothetical protein